MIDGFCPNGAKTVNPGGAPPGIPVAASSAVKTTGSRALRSTSTPKMASPMDAASRVLESHRTRGTDPAGGLTTVTCRRGCSSMAFSANLMRLTSRFPSTPKDAMMSSLEEGAKRMSPIICVWPRSRARSLVSLCRTRIWPARRP